MKRLEVFVHVGVWALAPAIPELTRHGTGSLPFPVGVLELAGGQVLHTRLIRRTDHRPLLAELARLSPTRVLESDNGPCLLRRKLI